MAAALKEKNEQKIVWSLRSGSFLLDAAQFLNGSTLIGKQTTNGWHSDVFIGIRTPSMVGNKRKKRRKIDLFSWPFWVTFTTDGQG